MSTDTIQSPTAAVFAAFIEADSALKELPKVRADLEAAHSLLDETSAKLEAEAKAKAEAEATIASLRATLAQREADLSAATFRGDKASALLDGLRGLLGGSGDHTGDTTAPVSASPQVETPQVATTSAQPQEASHEGNVNSGQRDSDPTVASTPTDADGPATAPSPANVAGNTHTEVPNAGSTSAFPPDIERDSLTTASSGSAPDTSTDTTQAGEASGNKAEAETSRQPWSAKPYWVTWADWHDLHHGEVPAWVTNDQDM